ncbi:MarR family winged helix-turn-helix transcriptional regulator [Amycolatopsis taiwanensis]|uniref:MarR family winged helix-turn-helix transcriptional regulator n=1 Tax=Amycolatopsis taiwanensis TaxID=342230 RepID=UPI0004B70AB9|nr:MarR family transcriptional regulator [Amycolatopsis taiwanensis]
MENLLGALALSVTDLALAGVTAAAGTSASGAAALVVLSTAPGLSVTELGRRVGLSQPAAARMVDALQRAGLVERHDTPTRAVAVELTRDGMAAAEHILGARGGRLTDLTRSLEPAERVVLAGLLDKLLAGVYQQVRDAERVCRLCDRAACIAGDQVCPIGAACRKAAGDDG